METSAVPIAATRSPRKNWLLIAGASFLVLLLVASSVEGWMIYKLRQDTKNQDWLQNVHVRDEDTELSTDTGSIQFLKKGGYSITFSTVKYTADGLYLAGEVGNPTAMSLSNLTIKFSVTKPLYQYRDEFDQSPYIMYVGPPPIGEASTSPIAYLGPDIQLRLTSRFRNVKQNKDGLRLVPTFSGERYSYPL